jgi:hypothetical protein
MSHQMLWVNNGWEVFYTMLWVNNGWEVFYTIGKKRNDDFKVGWLAKMKF